VTTPIEDVTALEVLDSRDDPTVRVTVVETPVVPLVVGRFDGLCMLLVNAPEQSWVRRNR